MKICIDGWKCGLTFSSAHFLADYSKCSRLHGHTYAVRAEVNGDAIDGIVIDFRILKNVIKEFIETLDHKIIIPTEGKFRIKTIKTKKQTTVEVTYKDKQYAFPESDCAFLPLYSSSAEQLATYILKHVQQQIDVSNITSILLGIDEGYGQGAWSEWKKKQSV